MTDEKKDRLSHVLARIPPEWGKWLSFQSGWDDIVEELDREIAKIYPDYEIHQVKEKFGTLRFYCEHDGLDGPLDKLIREAERKSASTCELCGVPGEMRVNGSWYATYCDKCAKENNYKKVNKEES